MATLVVQQAPVRHQSHTPPPPIASGLTIDVAKLKSTAVPNKHIPYCSPGPPPSAPLQASASAPSSPADLFADQPLPTVLYPPHRFRQESREPAVYAIDAKTLEGALQEASSRPLPDPRMVFPWLHGLHPENQIQQAFFTARRKNFRKVPKNVREVTIVKVGGDLSRAKLKGAIAPCELLGNTGDNDTEFLDIDPKEGFSVRNFHIQAAKLAMLSDIVLYKDDSTSAEELETTAKRIARAQKKHRDKCQRSGVEAAHYSTFVVSSPFKDFELKFPNIVALTAEGNPTGEVIELCQWERLEMYRMSRATEIAKNVWLGPSPDPNLISAADRDDFSPFDIMIDTNDLAHLPHPETLKEVAELSASSQQSLEFPASGSIMPPTWTHSEVDGLLEMCHWMYGLANLSRDDEAGTSELVADADGDIDLESDPIVPSKARRILIHCADGYTESTLLAMAYFMFVECIPVHEAWLRLHCEKQRNFFAYPTDMSLLTVIQPRIIQESPRGQGGIPSTPPDQKLWLTRLGGSLPSRILPYMYLGNLSHANHPELLRALGIKRVLSVGEPISWSQEDLDAWGTENLIYIDNVQDNGVDSLTDEFDRCLEFIGRGKTDGTGTLVHCRVGVSRSATICIAEVMSSLGLSFPHAYCFVRARRLNVIIQPHLRFAYELLKWEEKQQQKRGKELRRELEWSSIAREIAAMNKPYTR